MLDDYTCPVCKHPLREAIGKRRYEDCTGEQHGHILQLRDQIADARVRKLLASGWFPILKDGEKNGAAMKLFRERGLL